MARWGLVLVALLLLIGPRMAMADKRVALVIGNAGYRNVNALNNPANDARLMARTLEDLGFTLVGGAAQVDLDKPEFDRAVQQFGEAIAGGDVALFYYSGHGMQVDRKNWLVPVEANPTSPLQLPFQMVDADLVLDQMRLAGAKLNVVILDACRNNPFEGRGLRASGGGLAEMRAPEGTVISYATQPGNVASDGVGVDSPYTMALSRNMRIAGVDALNMFNKVGVEVKRATGGQQQPWVANSPIEGNFYFGGPAVAPAPAPVAGPTPESVYWQSIANSTNPADFEAYKQRFPNGIFTELADNRIVMLAAPPSPVATRPASPLSSPATGVIRDCPDCPELVRIPAGSFSMGVPADEEEREGLPDSYKGRSVPMHTVRIGQAFLLGRTHVTRGQYRAFARATRRAGGGCYGSNGGNGEKNDSRSWESPGFAQGDDEPVVCVSFDDAQAYVAWLSSRTGQQYRLPSEAEWEYAARAGTTTARYWSDESADQCSYAHGANETTKARVPGASDWTVAPCDDGYAYTAPVGHFRPNAFGLYDMLGNAWQWTSDCWNATYAGAPANGSSWEKGECASRVVRGGSWGEDPRALRAGYRGWDDAGDRSYYGVGFRVTRTLTP